MNQTHDPSRVLHAFGIADEHEYLQEAFSRNIGLLTPAEQHLLSHAKVAIPGLGGVGGVQLITLVRSGVGGFALADFDKFEPGNVNRQYGANLSSFGRSKLEVMKAVALDINPFLQINSYPEGIHEQNIDEFLSGCTVAIDAIDAFSIHHKRLLFKRAWELGIPVISAAPLGYTCAVIIFTPASGMDFDNYFRIDDSSDERERFVNFFAGISPDLGYRHQINRDSVSFDERRGPSSVIACQLCGAVAAMEALKLILNRGPIRSAPYYLTYDLFGRRIGKGKLRWGGRGPIQRLKRAFISRRLSHCAPSAATILPPPPTARGVFDEASCEYILAAALRAPSGDNVQPWAIQREADGFTVSAHPERDHSFFNHKFIPTYLACGALIENAVLAASQCGLRAEVRYFPDPVERRVVARLHLSPSEQKPDPLAQEIAMRCTNRKRYRRSFPVSWIAPHLNRCLEGMNGYRAHLLTDPKALKTLRALTCQADKIRLQDRSAHSILYHNIQWSETEARRNGYGFSIANLEAGVSGALFLRMTRSWPVMSMLNRLGLWRLAASVNAHWMKHCSGMVLITTPGFTDSDFLGGGRALERVWLTLTRFGLAAQPMSMIMFLSLWRHCTELEHIPKRLHRYLTLLAERYESLFPNVDFSRTGQALLLRIGDAPPQHARTFRLPSSSIGACSSRKEDAR